MSGSKSTFLKIPEQKTPYFSFPSHTITWKRDLSSLKKNLSSQDVEIFLLLHQEVHSNPKVSRKKIEALYEKYPTHPEILNLASFLYFSLHRIRMANRCIEENYRHNPSYLFAKINYADLCLRRNQVEKIPVIFENKFSLRALYPEKKAFHVSEFRGFMVLMGFYHLAIGNRKKASCYHYLAHRIDSKHPSIQVLQRKLYFSPWYRKLGKKIRINFANFKKISSSSI